MLDCARPWISAHNSGKLGKRTAFRWPNRLSQRTRVPEGALAAIERNDKSALPPHPFSRGFVRTYASEVDLDRIGWCADYFAQFPEQPPAALPRLRAEVPDTSWQSRSPWMGLATAFAILAVVVAAAVVRVAGAEPERSSNPSARLARRRPRPPLLHHPLRHQRFQPWIVRRQHHRQQHHRHRQSRLKGKSSSRCPPAGRAG